MESEQTATEPEQPTTEAQPEQAAAEPEPEPVVAQTSPEAQETPANVPSENVESKPVRTKLRSTDPTSGPDIAMGESGLSAVKPITVAEMLKITVSKVPTRTALKYKSGDTWNEITYQQFYDLAVNAAKSFLKVHLFFHVLYINTCVLFSLT